MILDNSLSMGYREERGERYDLAKKAAQKIMQGLKGQSSSFPRFPSGSGAGERKIRWMGPEEALKGWTAIPLSFGRGDPASALGWPTGN